MEKLTYQFTAKEADENERIDKFLVRMCPDFTRSYLQNLIFAGAVTVNQKPVKNNTKVHEGDKIKAHIPEPQIPDIEPEDIPLDILYEDDDIILVNKPKNMVVHPAPGHMQGTLVNALLYHCRGNLSGINGIMRPGIVHRIDRNTTGVLIACKNDLAHNSLAFQLKEHSITRRYQAIVYNHFPNTEGSICAPIGRHPVDRQRMAVNEKNGRTAVTHYQVMEELSQNMTHIQCHLETGRTHQIRVHLSYIGHPLLGDDVYGPAKSKFHLEGQTLHAEVLGFIHPRTHTYMEIHAPLPDYFQKLLSLLHA